VGEVRIGFADQDVTTVRGQRVIDAVVEGAVDVVTHGAGCADSSSSSRSPRRDLS
jgi:hypothetical protein